ncbi:MAG: FG-GAP-like repeat-containing protein [Myxococcota bacterium]
MRVSSFGTLLVCAGCQPYGEPASPTDPASVVLPDGTSDGWLSVVSTRIAAEGRAIHARDGAFVADLTATGLTARLGADGVVVSGARGEALALRTSAWGREGALATVGAREPVLGACMPELDAQGRCLRRLEYADGELTEWWIGLGTGLEQGWSVDTAPSGAGMLVVEVTVDGALAIDGGGEDVAITDADGRAWNVGRIAAWDAGGEPLPARIVADADSLRVEVDDTGARYPVTIDPVYETAVWSAAGDEATSSFAGSVAGAGDVNADGYDDVMVGGSGYISSTGRVYVYHGSASGLDTTATSTLTGEETYGYFGGLLASAGDVNGDSYDDVIVGAWGYGPYSGRAYLFHGSGTGVLTSPAVTLEGASGDELGYGVSGAGDVDGDGYADVIVGAPGYGADVGRAYLYHGSAGGLSTSATTTLTGSRANDNFGAAVSGAGDVNGDGYADVIVGADTYPTRVGGAYVHHGSAAGVATTATTTLTGAAALDAFGAAVSGAGDVDGDGYDDVIVGAWAYGSRAGRVYVYGGSAAGVSTGARSTLTGAELSDYFGAALSSAGDVNADGYADVIVGAHQYEYEGGAGSAYVYAGSATGLSAAAVTTWAGDALDDGFGYAVTGAGDVNGDGYADVIVGAFGYGDTGRAYVYSGSATGVPTSATSTCTGLSNTGFGYAVSGAGDVDNDGYDDVIVGAWGYSGSTGRAYLFPGSATGVATTAATTLTGEGTTNYFARSLSGAGDVNGDGYDDVIVGAYGYESMAGRVYLYPGSATGLSSPTTLTRAPGVKAFGYSVSDAGDLNGDGYADIVAGAPGYAYGDIGQVSVYAGSASGITPTAAGTLATGAIYDLFGSAVSGAGDVNGDGYDDVIVGAYRYEGSVGAAYVFSGTASGISTTPAATMVGESTLLYFAFAVSGAGDVNGDGYDEVMVGVPKYDDSVGRAYLYAGSASGVVTATPTVLSGEADGAFFGGAVSSAGDVNGDGYADVIVGAYGFDYDSLGRVFIYAGSASGLVTTPETTLVGEWDANFGYAVADAGDVNGDGYGDVIVGAYASRGYEGAAYVYLGYGDADGDGVVATEDCDDTDASLGAASTRYVDADGDGHGGAATAEVCPSVAGYASTNDDCDDTDPAYHPGAVETDCADPNDYNCDGTTGATDWDGDGWAACFDCNDLDASINAAAAEIVGDEVDGDCDGGEVCFADADGDRYAADGGATVASSDVDCADPGEAAASVPTGDCVDTDAAYHPGAEEIDCTDPNDYDCDGSVLYADADGDGWAACLECDDADASVRPDGVELVGDGVDSDCDNAELCYVDADGDGYRADATTVISASVACDGAGEASSRARDGDCDDADAAFHPGAAERDCTDPTDYNCDGSTAYADADGDGWVACRDCDDEDASINPDGVEGVDDGVDGDCDGGELCRADADADGYRPDVDVLVASRDEDCEDGGEATAATPTGDCDDADAAYHPGADESDCADPVDYNCDGATGLVDGDADGFPACDDCDDSVGDVHPDATELCNAVDDDCDGSRDEGATDASSWYLDRDGDGFTDPVTRVDACAAPHGYLAGTEADCDDTNAVVFPGATEVLDDALDQDCDGADATERDAGSPPAPPAEGGGCSSAGGGGGGKFVLLLALGMGIRRRRRRGSPHHAAGGTRAAVR